MNKLEKIDRTKYDEFIILGSCCEIGFIIKHFKLSENSYPFDWLLVDDVNDVCDVIDNNLAEFNNLTNVYHDFWKKTFVNLADKKISVPHLDAIPLFSQKIKNFNEISNTDKKILFVYKAHLYNRITPENAIKINETLSKKFKNYDVLVVNEYKSDENIEEESEYPSNFIINYIVDANPYDGERIIYCNILYDDPSKVKDVWEKIFNYLE